VRGKQIELIAGQRRDEAVAVLANIAKDRLPDGSHRVFSASVRNDKGLVIFTASLTLQSGWA
jgi:hypothetical protein